MKEIVVDSGLNQSRVALLEDGELVEYYIESKKIKRLVGNIYKGRVKNVLPGMQAAFVDIGYEKNAFLYVKDAISVELSKTQDIHNKEISIKDVVKNGQELIVQVTKEPIDKKGPRVTTHLTFPGRYLVLMPHIDYIGISRKIEDEEERERLKKILEEIKPKGIGVIIRTEGEGRGKNDFKEDLKYLIKLWQKIETEKNLGFAPKLIYKDLDLIHRTVRDLFTSDIDRLRINDRENYRKILDFLDLISPELKNKVEFFDPDINIFAFLGIDKMIKQAMSRYVWLKSGGYIVIDKTEALTVIDINTGKYVGSKDLNDTILKVNKEAAKEVAKQIRLRDIGGIIIIDFIDMNNQNSINEVINILSTELLKDRVRTNILGMTHLGLLEMTRKKVRNRISSLLEMECPYCEGTGKVLTPDTVIKNIEKEMFRISKHTNSEAVILDIHPNVYEVLNNKMDNYLKELEKNLGITIFIRKDKNVHLSHFNIAHMGSLSKIEKLIHS